MYTLKIDSSFIEENIIIGRDGREAHVKVRVPEYDFSWE